MARADSGPPTRGPLLLLRDPVVGPFILGKVLSSSGVWVHNVVAAIVVFQLTGSATLVGVVTAAQFIPQLVLSPWSGARADRASRKRQLIGGRLITALGSGSLVVWAATVGLTDPSGAVAVVAAAAVIGTGSAVGGPAMEALVPSLVHRSELASAVVLNAWPVTLARSVGPALGALLVVLHGPEAAFGLAAVMHLVFAAVIAWRLPDVAPLKPHDSSLRAGIRHVRSDPPLVALLIGIMAAGVGTDTVITLSPALAAAHGSGERLVGALGSAFGVGSALALGGLGPPRRRWGSARVGCAGLLLTALALAGVSALVHPVVSVLCMGLAGAGVTLSLTSLTSMLQHRAPDELRGRIMALWALAFLGSRPLAAMLNGALADLTSVSTALFLVVALLLFSAWSARPSRVGFPRQA